MADKLRPEAITAAENVAASFSRCPEPTELRRAELSAALRVEQKRWGEEERGNLAVIFRRLDDFSLAILNREPHERLEFHHDAVRRAVEKLARVHETPDA